MSLTNGGAHIPDTGLEPAGVALETFLLSHKWRIRRIRKFRRRLDKILPGEITAFRQGVFMVARAEPDSDITILTGGGRIHVIVIIGAVCINHQS